ncbi:thioesterase family protein [Nocardioides sp.]|uniref:acyl-CoA thioesterase n=1 Tax=Nocardioides sp. TaxID=35761 RepID=UPI0027361FFD|nr:thioesterase family protein [Nocardioides sp.]MDP3894040.1 thioesterase family protein [Nocardioides sp.]
MRHVYECPLRWADLDLLGHVNNVIYVDYLQEARIDMLLTHAPDPRMGDLAEGVVVVRHDVQFVAPLTLRAEPVRIDVWVTEIRAATFTMAYEVYDEDDSGGRTVYLRATTVLTPYVFDAERPRRLTPAEKDALRPFLEDPDPQLAPAPVGPARRSDIGHYPLHVRFSDVDAYGHVNNVKYFEYFQEARIVHMTRIWADAPAGTPEVPLVVAQVSVDYRVPILFRTEPYDVWSWVASIGRSSFVVESEIRDGDTVLSRARVVMVTFDPSTQRAAPAPEIYRELLVANLPDQE